MFIENMMTDYQNTQGDEGKRYEEFVNIAVHELKTPVSVLKAYLQMISRQLQLENQVSYMNIVEKMDLQLDKLLSLIADLQEGIHLNSEDFFCLMNDFDVNDSIKICCESTRAANPHCVLEYELDQGCPLIKGDHDRIEQVIHNLISNAIKYSGRDAKVVVKSLFAENNVVVSVLDNGPGIPADQQEKIFQQFYRVKGTANRASGLGLGLFICRDIINKHQGSIGVKSAEGTGSEFWFSLPVRVVYTHSF